MRLYFDKYIDAHVGTDDFTIRLSLFRDAVVQFSGCFSKKDKLKLNPEEVYAKHKNWEPWAQWFHDIRDAYAAHNFGPSRLHSVGAVLERSNRLNRMVFTGVGDFAARHSGPAAHTRDSVLRFMMVACQFVNQRTADVEERLLKQLAEIGPDTLLTYPDLEHLIPDAPDIRSTRESFRKKSGVARAPVHADRATRTPEGVKVYPRSDLQPLGPDEESPPQEPEPRR